VRINFRVRCVKDMSYQLIVAPFILDHHQ